MEVPCDSSQSYNEAQLTAFDLMNGRNVQAIIGPQTSEQAKFLAYMGTETHIPIIFFSAVSFSVTPSEIPYFVRMAQNGSSQVRAIAALVHAFKWREVAIIHDNSDNGIGLIPYITEAIQDIGVKVRHRMVLTSSNSSIHDTLDKISKMGTRVFIVHVPFSLGKRFFIQANKRGMMEEGYVWIITSELTNNLCYMSSRVLNSMQGVLGVKTFVPESEILDDFEIRWKQWFRRRHPEIEIRGLDPYILWAYDTTRLLAVAVEDTGFQFNEKLDLRDSKNLVHVFNLDVSPNGENYLKSILGTKIQGLTGGIQLVDGQLQSTDFQLVNVLGNGGRGIGYWTPKTGLSRSQSSKDTKKNYSENAHDLSGIIWPGGSIIKPKGLVFERKLRIGVPVKRRFGEFMKVDIDPNNNTIARGFCVDVFEKVMSMNYLHYPIQFEYVEYNNGHAGEPGYYAELIYQAHLKKFDAVVGDTTITANRSNYVDFTQPFLESGISMIVPILRDDFTGRLLWFIQPFKLKFLLDILFILAFGWFLVRFFGHVVNTYFQGRWYQMLVRIIRFLAQLNRMASVGALLRFIIKTSYEAYLTLMLMIDKLQRPAITDIYSLKKNGDYVGYQTGSFVFDYLKSLGFPEDKLKSYGTVDEYAEALSRGSSNNGVSAIVDETPYIKVFLNKYSNQYTMAGPTYKTSGLGFVFQRGSDMVADVSRAVLSLSESKDMIDIKNKWFEPGTRQEAPRVADEGLSFHAFRALVYIAAGTGLLAILAYICVNYVWPKILEAWHRNQPGNDVPDAVAVPLLEEPAPNDRNDEAGPAIPNDHIQAETEIEQRVPSRTEPSAVM